METIRRTKRMLVRVWKLSSEPLSTTPLGTGPGGLGKSSNDLRALETPIEIRDFADVAADVAGVDLAACKTVADLSDTIWAGIPATSRARRTSRR